MPKSRSSRSNVKRASKWAVKLSVRKGIKCFKKEDTAIVV